MKTIDEILTALSSRFLGVDLQYRRTTTCSAGQWPAPWRARLLTSKNERASYRMDAFGHTAQEAAQHLANMVYLNDVRIAERQAARPLPGWNGVAKL